MPSRKDGSVSEHLIVGYGPASQCALTEIVFVFLSYLSAGTVAVVDRSRFAAIEGGDLAVECILIVPTLGYGAQCSSEPVLGYDGCFNRNLVVRRPGHIG